MEHVADYTQSISSPLSGWAVKLDGKVLAIFIHEGHDVMSWDAEIAAHELADMVKVDSYALEPLSGDPERVTVEAWSAS